MNKEMTAVSRVFGISEDELKSSNRALPKVLARMAYARLRYEAGTSYVSIGRELNRTHATMIYYIQSYNQELLHNAAFKKRMLAVREMLKSLNDKNV